MIAERMSSHLRPRGADWSGVLIWAYTVHLDDRIGGVGGSAVLRAIRAVSSASRARGRGL
jgi:asparagine synthetase B (glutamine-hydrolysing)